MRNYGVATEASTLSKFLHMYMFVHKFNNICSFFPLSFYTHSPGLSLISENCGKLSHLAIPQCRHVSAATLVEAVKRCSQLKELIIVGCLQISRDEVLDIVRASKHHMKTMRVSRPDSPQDEYTILKRHGTWILPSWARDPSPPRYHGHGEVTCAQ